MKRTWVLGVWAVWFSLALAPVCAFAQEEQINIPIKIDHRGLLEISGVLRTNSEGSWGSNNLIVKPFGGWAAQDYCLKNIQKNGNKLTADFSTNPAAKLAQVIEEKTDSEGKKSLKLTATLTPASGGNASYEALYYIFPLASKDFAGAKVTFDDGSELVLPEEPGGNISVPDGAKSISISNGKTSLTLKTTDLRVSIKDQRPKATAFHIWLEYPSPKDKSEFKLEFEISAESVPFTAKADGKEWLELPVATDIVEGGILDFSFLTDAPAGKYGRIIANKDGHFAYEKKPDARVKLVGANLCFSANYLKKEDADKLARTFRRMGYNTIRFHHTDVDLINGNWNARKSDDISAEQLDKLDYLFAAMKKEGMYVSIDLFTMRRFGAEEIAGWNKYVDNPGIIKGLVPILPGAFEAWTKMALAWLNHFNPYTGIAWKDDPALLSICPLNEDSIFSSWRPTPEVGKLYTDRFEVWLKEKNLSGGNRDALFAQFLIEVKMESNRQIEKFFKDNGINALITGSNWWNTMAQTFTRDQFEVVDNHQYADHPQPHYLPSKYNQGSTMRGSLSYSVPAFMMPTRIFGKPFTVTEWNFCAPNQHRAEAGAMFGAYSALQGWDGLYRFAWAHSAKNVTQQEAISGFDIATDPLSLLTERQVILLYARGDVSPARNKYVYAVNMQEATKEGVGDMWGKGLFPRAFTVTGLVSQVGSQAADSGRRIEGKFTGVVAADAPADSVLAGNPFIAAANLPRVPASGEEIVSDTGELTLNSKQGYVKVVTAKTECIVSPEGIAHTGKNLSLGKSDVFCSVSASAMDDKPLETSKRVLILHLTNILNTNMQFTNRSMTTLLKRGELPYIVRAGSVSLSLRNSNPRLKLYAVDFGGKRLREVKTAYANGAYTFTAEISAVAGQPTMIYELAEK